VHAYLVLAPLCAALAAAPAGQKHNLRKVPVFRPGDRILLTEVSSDVTSWTATEGGAKQQKSVVRKGELSFEALEVSKEGKVQSFRARVASARTDYTFPAPTPARGVEIRGLRCVARRSGAVLGADTESIRSETTKQLSAPQLALVKHYFDDSMHFGISAEYNSLLMPAAAVAVGSRWKVPAEDIARWCAERDRDKGSRIKVVSAEFELVAVKDGVADVRGEMKLAVPELAGQQAPSAEMGFRIDLATGVCVSTDGVLSFKGKIGATSVAMKLQMKMGARLVRGNGKPSAEPAKMHKLGWKKPGKDTNSYVSRARGFSLTPPAGCRQKLPAEKGCVEFKGPSGAISVHHVSTSVPMKLDEAAELLLKRMKTVKGYQLVRSEDLKLPGAVHARLVRAKMEGGLVMLLSMVAVSGDQLVMAQGVVANVKAADVEKVDGALRTLRLYRPRK
jgi:hypothetical protein